MKKVAVLIKDVEQQYEGLRVSLGALLDEVDIQMMVLNHEIANMDEAYRDNMEFLDEMEGQRVSNHMANAEKYNFQHATLKEIADRLKNVDIIIPF
jgi:NAD/NADP transhydrogenase alpha subunit